MKIFTIKNNKISCYIILILKKLIIFLFWVVVWQISYLCIDNNMLLASPIDVFYRLFDLCKDTGFWNIVVSSMMRIIQGFIYGTIIGVLLSLITCSSNILKDLFKPIINVVQSTPIASFIILALVWIKSGIVPIFISALMVIPIIWTNVTEGIIKTDTKLLEMAKIYKLNKISKIKMIYIPSVIPYFTAACTTALGLSWKAGVAAEVIANTRYSIGGEIYKSKMYLETVDLFSFTVVVIILSFILEYIIVNLMKLILSKYSFSK